MVNKILKILFQTKYCLYYCSLILAVYFPSNLSAGEPFSLEACIEYAISHNPELLSTKKDIAIAKSSLQLAKSAQLPTITGSVSYQDYEDLPIIVTSFGEFPMGWKETYDIQLSISQPLFTWGKISRSIQQAKYRVQLAQEAYRLKELEIIYQVKQAFYTVLLAREMVRVNEQSVAVAEAHLQHAQSHVRAGTVSNYEVLRAEVELANVKPELIKSENNLKLAYANLATILGWKEPSSLEITGRFEIPIGLDTTQTNRYTIATSIAFLNRPDWKIVLLTEKIDELAIPIAAAGTKPTVALAGIHDRKSSDWDSDIGGWNYYSYIMLGVTWSLYDGWATKSNVAIAQANREKTRWQKEQLALTIQLEVEQAILDLASAKEIIISQQKTIEQAKESLRLAQSRYQNGVGTHLEVLDAEVALTRAETNYAQALFNYGIAVAKLEKVTGTSRY
ncbi:MAG: TolC family protein [bacterium]|nr:TolC family protein [bacterium]